MKRKESILILVLVAAVVGLAMALVFLGVNGDKETVPKPRPVVLGTNATSKKVVRFLNAHTKAKLASNDIVWNTGAVEDTPDNFYAYYQATTKKLKAIVKEELEKLGLKTYRLKCYNLYANDESWSLGYCTRELISDVHKTKSKVKA